MGSWEPRKMEKSGNFSWFIESFEIPGRLMLRRTELSG